MSEGVNDDVEDHSHSSVPSSSRNMESVKDAVHDNPYEYPIPRRPVYVDSIDPDGRISDGSLLSKVDRRAKVVSREGKHGSVACASVRGWQTTMEDFAACNTTEDYSCIGVYDGHNGRACAEFVAGELETNLVSSLEDNLKMLSDVHSTFIHTKHVEAYDCVDADFLLGDQPDSCVGCTGATVLSAGGTVVVSWVGDCAVFLRRRGTVVPLTEDHIPANVSDQLRVQRGGGVLVHDQQFIKLKKSPDLYAVTRAFGAYKFKYDEAGGQDSTVISSAPDTTQLTPGTGDTLVLVASASLLACRGIAGVAEEIEQRLAADEELPDIVEAIVCGCVAEDSGEETGVENLSLAALLLPDADAPNRVHKLTTTSLELFTRWRGLNDPDLPTFSVHFGLTRDLRQSFSECRPGTAATQNNTDAGDADGTVVMSPKGDQLAKATLPGGGAKPVVDPAVKVHLFSGHAPLLLGWGCSDFARGDGVGGGIMIAAGIGYIALALASSRKVLPAAAIEALLLLLVLLVAIGYDAALRCQVDTWCLSIVAPVVLAVVSLRPAFVLTGWFLGFAWVTARTVDERYSYGLCDIEAEYDNTYFVGTLFARLTAMLLSAGVAVITMYTVEQHATAMDVAIRAVQEALTLQQLQGTVSNDMHVTHVELVVQKCDTADPTHRLGEAVGAILLNGMTPELQETERNEVSMSLASHVESHLTSHHPADTDSTPASVDPLEAGSPPSRFSGYQRRQASILTVALQKDQRSDLYKYFAKIVLQAVEASEGHLIRQEGNIAVIGWNTADPFVSHAQQALACVQCIEANVSPTGPVNIAIVSGNVFVSETPSPSRSTVHVTGRPCTQSFLLCRYARMVRAKVVMTDKVYEANRSQIEARPIDSIIFNEDAPGREKARPDIIYELLGPRTDSSQNISAYTSAFSHLQQLKVQEAKTAFAAIMEQDRWDRKDYQVRRLHTIACWLYEHELAYLAGARCYYRRVGWELEGIAESSAGVSVDRDDEIRDDDSFGRGGRKTGAKDPVHEESVTNPLRPRLSLNHESKVLRRLIREVEAEENLEDLEAWGLVKNKKHNKGERGSGKVLPIRFNDHKHRVWCRSTRCLGKGAFGEVWLGMASDGCLVAMKSMKLPTLRNEQGPTGMMDTQFMSAAVRRRLERQRRAAGGQGGGGGNQDRQQIDELIHEVGLMNKLRHDNIVSYMASAVVDGYVMIVMEYLSGGSLHDMLTSFSVGTIPLTSIQRYVQDIVRGLEFLHSHDIIHRDMKPHNVLLLVDGQCKLADFGASAGLSELAKTTQGTIGTPLYMAPEACRGRACKASDIWALGIIVCQLFTGNVPYAQKEGEQFNPHSFMYRLGNSDDFAPCIPAIPMIANEFARVCLLREPDDRPTATDLKSHAFVLN